MSLETFRSTLLWSGLINYVGLLIWVAIALLAPGFNRWAARLFRVQIDRFDAIQYAGIVLYKLGIWMFFLIPYIVLRFIV